MKKIFLMGATIFSLIAAPNFAAAYPSGGNICNGVYYSFETHMSYGGSIYEIGDMDTQQNRCGDCPSFYPKAGATPVDHFH